MEIQLCGIDTPDTEQSLGIESRDHLRALIEQGGGRVVLVKAGTDRDGRTVTEAFISTDREDEPEIHLNAQMLADGMAYLAPAFIDTCSNGYLYAGIQDMAKDQAVGIWALTHPETP